jgi:plastocyanin
VGGAVIYGAFTEIGDLTPMRTLYTLALLFAFTATAHAADLTVQVRTAAGKPQPDAVVMVYPDVKPASATRAAGPFRMVQKNMQFDPFVLIVPVGAEVAFPNLDTVRHHVYSFSAARPFELKLYGKDEARTVKFDKPGVVAIGCNIHDMMMAFIRIVDTPYAAKTDASGRAVLHDLPNGSATIRIWHPYLKAKDNEIAKTASLSGAAQLVIPVEMRPAPERMDY